MLIISSFSYKKMFHKLSRTYVRISQKVPNFRRQLLNVAQLRRANAMDYIGLPSLRNLLIVIILTVLCVPLSKTAFNIFGHNYDKLDQKYGSFTEDMRIEMLEEVRKMFYFSYDGYMKYAFPLDELDPIHCVGRGPDHDNP